MAADLHYIVPELWALMLDVNTTDAAGTLTDADDALCAFFADVNAAYFAGHVEPALTAVHGLFDRAEGVLVACAAAQMAGEQLAQLAADECGHAAPDARQCHNLYQASPLFF